MSNEPTLPIRLTVSEIAEISQRALAERIIGRPGVFQHLWDRIDRQLNEQGSMLSDGEESLKLKA